jgi:hypothetical protein
MGEMVDRLERLEDEPNLDWIAVPRYENGSASGSLKIARVGSV